MGENGKDDSINYPLLSSDKQDHGSINTNSDIGDLEKPDGENAIALKKSYPEVMLVALAAFSAYAMFVTQQHKLSDAFFKDTSLTKDALEVAKRDFQHGKLCTTLYIYV